MDIVLQKWITNKKVCDGIYFLNGTLKNLRFVLNICCSTVFFFIVDYVDIKNGDHYSPLAWKQDGAKFSKHGEVLILCLGLPSLCCICVCGSVS